MKTSRSLFCSGILIFCFFLASCGIINAQFQRRPTPNDNLVSTEVLPGDKVVFRIYAPQAESVTVTGYMGWNQRVDFVKASVGVWTGTFE
jgi:hypothetical protein